MYAVGDAQWLMYPVGDGGGEEDLCHVRSGGHSVADVPSGGWGRRGGSLPCTQWRTQWLMYPCTHVRSGGCSVTHVPSGGWERKGGSLPCTQWGTLRADVPMGDGGGEEDLCQWGTLSG